MPALLLAVFAASAADTASDTAEPARSIVEQAYDNAIMRDSMAARPSPILAGRIIDRPPLSMDMLLTSHAQVPRQRRARAISSLRQRAHSLLAQAPPSRFSLDALPGTPTEWKALIVLTTLAIGLSFLRRP